MWRGRRRSQGDVAQVTVRVVVAAGAAATCDKSRALADPASRLRCIASAFVRCGPSLRLRCRSRLVDVLCSRRSGRPSACKNLRVSTVSAATRCMRNGIRDEHALCEFDDPTAAKNHEGCSCRQGNLNRNPSIGMLHAKWCRIFSPTGYSSPPPPWARRLVKKDFRRIHRSFQSCDREMRFLGMTQWNCAPDGAEVPHSVDQLFVKGSRRPCDFVDVGIEQQRPHLAQVRAVEFQGGPLARPCGGRRESRRLLSHGIAVLFSVQGDFSVGHRLAHRLPDPSRIRILLRRRLEFRLIAEPIAPSSSTGHPRSGTIHSRAPASLDVFDTS